jgi:hypothetical protein
MSHEANSSEIYGKYPREKVFEVVKAAPWLRDQQFTSADMPTLHKQVAHPARASTESGHRAGRKPGATFVESLGGLPVTPELEN